MHKHSKAFLTIAMEATPLQLDPLDCPGESKRMMIQKADELVDGAIARMPGYLQSLPREVLPSVEDLQKVFRRHYRLNGPRLEMDLCVIPSSLPAAWVESMVSFKPLPTQTPWPIVWVTRIMGLWFGLGKADQEKVMAESHAKVVSQKRDTIQEAICHGIMRLTGAAVETELRNNHVSLMAGGPLLSIVVRRMA